LGEQIREGGVAMATPPFLYRFCIDKSGEQTGWIVRDLQSREIAR